MARVTHFELPSTDMTASRKFYENVFGWKFTKWGEGPMEYWLISTGDPDTPGIDGGLGGAANEMKATVNTVEVENLDASIKMVEANGGQVIMPKEEIPGMGWLAYISEPGGGVVGLFQGRPDSGV
jgi:predicted enzyme related to lactoylglutathione lyase